MILVLGPGGAGYFRTWVGRGVRPVESRINSMVMRHKRLEGLGGLGRLARLWALLPLVAALGACDDFGLRTRGQGELRWIITGSGPDTRAEVGTWKGADTPSATTGARTSASDTRAEVGTGTGADTGASTTDTRGSALDTRAEVGTGSMPDTRASAEIPDTNDFILKVSDAGGKVLYEGAYGESPESLLVDAGSYTVAVHSIEFTAPGFSRPVYGDEQVVVVKAGSTVTVRLNCILENAGVRLQVAPDFLTSYPDGVLYLKSGDTRLMYGYSEKRIAYFKPGPISLVLNNRGVDEVLLTRTLDARTILTLNLSAPHGGTAAASSITVAVDTAKVWNHESYVIGGGSGSGGSGSGSGLGDDSASDIDNAYSVAQAHDHTGEDDVWVFGYIVGGDLSTAGTTVKTSKLTKATHLAIASRSTVTAKASCVAVELPKGAIRDALNLVDHPDLIGTRVYLKGSLVPSYFGTTGLKSVSDYVLK